MILVKSLVLATNSFQTMRLLRLPHPQAEQLFRRMVFNVAKKFTIILKTSLSPKKQGEWNWHQPTIFWLYRPDSDWVSQHNLASMEKVITKDDLLSLAKV
jgi:serine/threonine-protein kinase HipA